MEKYKILIAEDVNSVAVDLKNTVAELGYKVQNIVTTGDKCINEIEKDRPDVVLLDINLKGRLSGIEVAVMIRENYHLPVLFLTDMDDYDTFKKARKANVYGYVLKPFNPKQLQASLEMAIFNHEKFMELSREKNMYMSMVDKRTAQDFIFVRADYKLNKIKLDDIYFIEALKDYVVINTGDNIYTTHTTMKQMMRVLPQKDFVRTHRSFICRMDKIFSIKYPDLVIEGKMKVIPIGGLYRKELYKRLNII